jgi:flagellar motility protein MotE (MotC chaperone)
LKKVPLKDSLSKIGKYLEDGVSNVAYKSENFVEVSKINMAISSEEKMIEDIYKKIGRKIYKDYKEKKVNDKSLIDKCEEIETIEKDINALNKKLLKLKDKKCCKKCGAEMDKTAVFCPKCGREQ